MDLPEKIVALHSTLRRAAVPHAFGGALALAWCTGRARGTIDIDINLFVEVDQAALVCEAFPETISIPSGELQRLAREGQVRLWWGTTPIDVFLNTLALHERASSRIRWEQFLDHSIPFLACTDLAIFKAFYNRTKDWADLEEMASAGTLDVTEVTGVIVEHLGGSDERVVQLGKLSDLMGTKPDT